MGRLIIWKALSIAVLYMLRNRGKNTAHSNNRFN